mmetsp:Transcript_55860/g.99031  ORF Transcript_55860/g.99031 Transcript_55860/m.99031 type:complete len:247 (+) Transcript_55860:400-1140(+)
MVPPAAASALARLGEPGGDSDSELPGHASAPTDAEAALPLLEATQLVEAVATLQEPGPPSTLSSRLLLLAHSTPLLITSRSPSQSRNSVTSWAGSLTVREEASLGQRSLKWPTAAATAAVNESTWCISISSWFVTASMSRRQCHNSSTTPKGSSTVPVDATLERAEAVVPTDVSVGELLHSFRSSSNAGRFHKSFKPLLHEGGEVLRWQRSGTTGLGRMIDALWERSSMCHCLMTSSLHPVSSQSS